jgi:hypothetical protein
MYDTDTSSSECDSAANARFLLASAMYESLAITNGTKADSQSSLKTAISALLGSVNTQYGDYVPDLTQFNDMASFGFNQDLFRWLVRRLVEMYRNDHYEMFEFDDRDIKGLQYWVPDLTPSR